MTRNSATRYRCGERKSAGVWLLLWTGTPWQMRQRSCSGDLRDLPTLWGVMVLEPWSDQHAAESVCQCKGTKHLAQLTGRVLAWSCGTVVSARQTLPEVVPMFCEEPSAFCNTHSHVATAGAERHHDAPRICTKC